MPQTMHTPEVANSANPNQAAPLASTSSLIWVYSVHSGANCTKT